MQYRYEYLCILSLIFVSFGFVLLLFIVSYLISPRKIDPEKISPYECGFNPFEDSRVKFDVKFYLVSILFIIFDLEVIFLFPWAVTVHYTRYIGVCTISIFLVVLTVGFIYEWKKGALDWD